MDIITILIGALLILFIPYQINKENELFKDKFKVY